MIGIKAYWLVAAVGIIICIIGVFHGYYFSIPIIANRYGVVAVALTFGMLFLSRGTAFKLLDTPVSFATSATPIDERLQKSIADLSKKKFAEATTVRALVDCLVDLDIKAEVALINNKREDADKFNAIVIKTIEELQGTKRTAVEANFLAKRALHNAQRNREGLATLLDINRRESLPIATLSIVATLCAGLGDAFVKILG